MHSPNDPWIPEANLIGLADAQKKAAIGGNAIILSSLRIVRFNKTISDLKAQRGDGERDE